MNRTQLAAFTAVAEAGGFTKGAQRLMVSQPAVSLQVAELETALKATLFDRLPRGVRLTAAGELLLGYARRIDSLEHEAESAIANLLGLSRGKLVVGASLTIGSYLLPATLGRFRYKYPQIELVMEIANTHQIERMLLENRLDLAFTEGLVPSDVLAAQIIQEDRLVPIAPPRHSILKHKRITAAMLCREELILREPGSGTREVIENALAKRKLTVKPLMSLGSAEAIKRAVQAGIGLSIVSELTIGSEVSAGTLVVVPVVDLSIKRPLVLLRLPGKSDGPAAKAFVELVQGR
ncbi:MAG: LysR family transcriptional regulator [Tepidisphaeraceae bacterium]